MRIVVNIYRDSENLIRDKFTAYADDESYLPQVSNDIEEFLYDQLSQIEEEME